jgi:small subunit ribosomal protein S2
MPYVTERWMGGTLTNFSTIKKSVKHLKNIEKMATDGSYDNLLKKEILNLEREKEKLEKSLGGIKDMARLPGAVFIIDTKKEAIAVAEAKKLNIPVFGMLDTNSDPDPIDYPIPANDDAFKSISLIVHTVSEAIIESRPKDQAGLEAALAAEGIPVPDATKDSR